MEKGKLYLIPTPLGENDPLEVIPLRVLEMVPSIRHFFVEELRSGRRFLSKAGHKGQIDSLSLYELNEHTTAASIEGYLTVLLQGNNAALISEAGIPAVADPGALLVELAHRNGIRVIPMSGPSSLILALAASGMNGQNFAFNGYLPVKPEERRAKIRKLEQISRTTGQSQLFIETPYRNNSLLADILLTCQSETRLCLAAEITLPDSFIVTKSVAEWRRDKPDLNKKPCVFIL